MTTKPLACCMAVVVQVLCARAGTPDYFPLHAGNWWTYSETDTTFGVNTDFYTLAIYGDTTFVGEPPASEWRVSYVSDWSTGDLRQGFYEKSGDSLFEGTMQPDPNGNAGFVPVSLFIDAAAGSSGDTIYWPDTGHQWIDTLIIRTDSTVNVHAGTFECMVTEFKCRYRSDIFGRIGTGMEPATVTNYKAPNVGLVKKIIRYNLNTLSRVLVYELDTFALSNSGVRYRPPYARSPLAGQTIVRAGMPDLAFDFLGRAMSGVLFRQCRAGARVMVLGSGACIVVSQSGAAWRR